MVLEKETLEKLARKLKIFSSLLSGGEEFTVRVSDKTRESFCTKKKLIVVGLLDFLEETTEELVEELGFSSFEEYLTEVGKALLSHELSHARFTSFEITFSPFSLLNVLEDQRIEKRICEELPKLKDYFRTLHRSSFIFYHLEELKKYPLSFHPIQLILLARWRTWDAVTEKEWELIEQVAEESLQGRIKASYPDRSVKDLIKDCKEAVERATSATSTSSTVEVADWWFEKWKELFENYPDFMTAEVEGVEIPVDAEDFEEGEIRDENDEEVKEIIEESVSSDSSESGERKNCDKDCSDDADTDPELTDQFLHPELVGEWEGFRKNYFWDWDKKLLSQLKKVVERWTASKSSPIRDYSMTNGKRVAPKRIVQRKLDILRRELPQQAKGRPKRFLFVIDGSGSMYPARKGSPFYFASHLARALSETQKSDCTIALCNDYLRKPVIIKDTNDLRRYSYGSGEGLRIVEPLFPYYDKVVFFTDGMVSAYDLAFLRAHQKKFIVVYSAGNFFPSRVLVNAIYAIKEVSLYHVIDTDIVKLVGRLGKMLERIK